MNQNIKFTMTTKKGKVHDIFVHAWVIADVTDELTISTELVHVQIY